jgi:hypothetical protein
MYQTAVRISSSISFWIIAALAGLLPLFFLPASWGGVLSVKAVFLYSGVFLATAIWLFTQFLQGSLTVPKHRVLAVVGLWLLGVLLSTLFSANTSVSLWGRGFGIDSFIMALALGLLVFLVASYAREQKKLVTLFLATFMGSALTVLTQVVLYIVGHSSFAHVVTNGTIVGTWVDFSYLVTLTLIIALLMYEVLAPKGFFKIFSLATMLLCTIVLVFLNFTTAWIVTIISALLVFVYKSSVERSISKFFPASDEHKPAAVFPFMSFGVLMVGVFFFLASASVGARIANSVGLSFNDARPSFATTNIVLTHSLAQDPILGAGPGRFAQAWDLHRPAAVSQSIFWNTSFESGFSTLQTMIVTNGLLPVILLLIAIALSIVHGFKLFSYKFPDRFSRFIAVATLIMVLAFTVLFFLGAVGVVLTMLGFFYIGLLVGVSQLVSKTTLVSWNYLKDPRKSFLTILLLVILMIGCVGVVYGAGKRFASVVAFSKALTAADADTAERFLARALSLTPNDIYWRARTSLHASQFVRLAQSEAPDKAKLQSTFAVAETSAQSAVVWDKTSAQNWLTLAQVYQLVVANDNPDILNAAKEAALQARTRNPNNPLYPIVQAQLAFSAKEYQTALDLYTEARTLAPGNADAWIGMVDSLVALGRRTEATEILDVFAQAFPTIEGVEQKKASIEPAPAKVEEKSKTQ